MNSKNILDSYEAKINKQQTKIETLSDSMQRLYDKNYDLTLFKITNNGDAQNYYYETGIELDKIEDLVTDALYSTNTYEGEEHPYIPYLSTTDNKMMINQIRVVNHKWVLANFTDGKFWGELFLNYQIEGNAVSFELKDYILYTGAF
jgi:hypothetical protein